ncbi:MAG TPA: GSU2403 family nucleotidyltransferase fold protein, partial [Alphaproteobacteria bacterium]
MVDTSRRPPLFTPHRRALTVLYADLESHALGQHEVFVGTAGSVIERKNASGFRFYAHQFYDGEGRKRERYLAGPVGDPKADAAAADLRERIKELKEIVPSLRLLGREGFNLVDARTYATLASLHNHGVFGAGGMLIGSHAYGVLLNRLGVRATPYATEDIDVARREALAFEKQPEQGLLDMLKDSGISFVEVPSLNRKKPPTSFKQRGRSRFHVDLLVPSAN